MKYRKLTAALLSAAMLFSAALYVQPPEPEAALTLTASAADYASDTLAEYAYEVAEIVNRERAAYGLAPLKYSDQLSDAALVRAQEIQRSFSHTRPNGTDCFTAMTEAGIRYTYAGENIAYGQRSPEEVMRGWMNSEGHRANILDTRAEYIGIGVTQRNGVLYWSQFFAASDMLSGSTIPSGTPAQTTAPAATDAPAATTTTTTAETVTTAPASTSQIQVPGCGSVLPENMQDILQKIKDMLGINIKIVLK